MKKKKKVNKDLDYSVQGILGEAVPLFKNKLNQLYFEKTMLQLGTTSGMVISKFESFRGKGFWNYIHAVSKGHTPVLAVLTTGIGNLLLIDVT